MKVSVVMSCYNAEKELQRSVESILGQTFTDFEFIILNDGSTDNTQSILDAYKRKDKRIVLITNKNNIGLSASLNKGIRMARTSLIARMDSDDYALPQRLDVQYNYMATHPRIDILGTAIHRITIMGDKLSTVYLKEYHDDIIKDIYSKPPVYHPTIVIRKRVFDQISYYNPELRWAEDSDLWYRIYDQVKFHNLQEPLLIYTVKNRLTYSKAKTNFMIKYRDIKKRNLLNQEVGQLCKDVIILSKNMISSRF